MSGAKRRFRLLRRREELQQDVDDELQFHLEMRARGLEAEGFDKQTARDEAGRRFGNLDSIRADLVSRAEKRRMALRRGSLIADLRQDVVAGLRSLRMSAGFTAVAIVTLALGMGATTAVFSVVNAVLLRPLPYDDPASLLVVLPVDKGVETVAPPGLITAWREASEAFEYLVGVTESTVTISGDETPERVNAFHVPADYFAAIGVEPRLGRGFTAQEDTPGSATVAVLSHRLWTTRFGADTGIVGSAVRINGNPHTVLGIMPASLDFDPGRGDLWLPLALSPAQQQNMGGARFVGLGRLLPGLSPDQAQERLSAVVADLDLRSDDDDSLLTARAIEVGRYYQRDVAAELWGLLAAVFFVLLIGCLNLANLMLARGAVRAEELAIRKALGASRGRVVRQLLVETLLLAIAGASAGLMVARWAVSLMTGMMPTDVPRLHDAGLDGAVLLFAAILAVVTSLTFGLLPALRVSRVPLQQVIKRAGSPADVLGRPDLLRRGLVVAEVALSLVLVSAAGLMLRSVWELNRVSAGVDDEVLTLQVALPFSTYPAVGDALRTFRQLGEEIAALPGIEAVAMSSRIPLAGASMGLPFAADGRPFEAGSQANAGIRIVTPGYFSTMGISLVRGRDLTGGDTAGATRVVVVNQALIEALALGPDPLGARLKADGRDFRDDNDNPWTWEIVGVVSDVRDSGLRTEAQPEVYFSVDQVPEGPWNWSGRQVVVAARGAGDPADLLRPIQAAVRRVDPDLPVDNVRTMEQRVAGSMALERFGTALLSLLGALGLVLAGVGIFGVVSYLVGRRTAEIGVRLALGATPRSVQWLVVAQSMQPVILGLGLGVVASLQTARVLGGLVYGIPATDPGTFAAAVACLAGVALAASWLPARRAARVDPAQTLRRH